MLSVNSGVVDGVDCYIVVDAATDRYACLPKVNRMGDSLDAIFLSRDSLIYSSLPEVLPELTYIADLPELDETVVMDTVDSEETA